MICWRSRYVVDYRMKTESEQTSDPKVHARNIQKMLTEIIDHVREDVDRVSEPKAQALFETTAEVLIGLRTAYEHYETGAEKAMR
ncbi:MAG: hypothetical protein K0Q55_1310 [Verrucomicrobia bacterium]|nr:hypothetical protein [Verrucomicrobiota bacterium]